MKFCLSINHIMVRAQLYQNTFLSTPKYQIQTLFAYLILTKHKTMTELSSKFQSPNMVTLDFSPSVLMYLCWIIFTHQSFIFIIIFFQLQVLKVMSSKLKWSEEEQKILKRAVNIQSKRKWVDIANQINALCPDRQRTSKQCRQKYINHVQYSEEIDKGEWTEENEHTLFKQYLELGSQWKLISKVLPGKSQNAVKNKFYGKIRKLVRKLNNICRQRINRSNKPLRDQSIMRIIDIKEGFENLPQHLILESLELKKQLLGLAEKKLAQFDSWGLVEQDDVVSLIKKIHRFNINSRYYCSRRRKNESVKNVKRMHRQTQAPVSNEEIESMNFLEMKDEKEQKSQKEVETFKIIPIIPIIMPLARVSQVSQ